MKKAFRKLVPTLIMMLVAASMVGTSTYAWFSMNRTVTVTGLQVTAKSNETFLLISATNTTAGTIQTENSKAATVTIAEPAVYPCAPVLSSDEAAYIPVGGKTVSGTTIQADHGGAIIDTAAKAANTENWYTAYSDSPSTGAINTATAMQLESFTDYVIHQTLYLTVASGANAANNLSVTATFTLKTGAVDDLSAVKMIVTTNDGGFATLSNASPTNNTTIRGNNTSITDSTVRIVDVYIYYDGTASVVNTNNKSDLGGVDIGLAFDVSYAG